MNIQDAKEEIKRSVSIYLMKDEFGNYRIPLERQRPVFMIGAPGIGKTAIMAQIAKELGISLVSYSMTHHTRQSALGLPFIDHRTYQGKPFEVSVYTLSEILATVYENMEKSGKKEGILFLDEINCVSETLGPSMLQFLQYKTFGNHQLPEGWVVVTAGNPPEYNRAVHEFDIATLDRLKVLHVEPDFEVWKRYAEQKQLHQAILSFLEIHPDDFYRIQTTPEGRTYVTARGWEDLSEALQLFEEKGYRADEEMIHEYLSDPEVAENFASYYDLYRKYRDDYQIASILAGKKDAEISKRILEASFDECISVTSLLMEAVMPAILRNIEQEDGQRALLNPLRKLKQECMAHPELDLSGRLEEIRTSLEEEAKKVQDARGLTDREKRIVAYECALLRQTRKGVELERPKDAAEGFRYAEANFQREVHTMKQNAESIRDQLANLFQFLKEQFSSEEEMLLAVTQFTVNTNCARFLAQHPVPEYTEASERLLVKDRNADLLRRVHDYQRTIEKEGVLSL